ncbi:unnamed protein product [Alopecurus aequalis]
MPALMAQRSSATRNQIRRELERRRKSINVVKGLERRLKLANAPKEGVAKKGSAAPALPPRLIPAAALKLANAPKEGVAKKGSASLPLPRVLIPTGAPGAARNKITYMELGEAPKRLTHPRRSQEALIPFAMKAPKPMALIPHAPAAATKLSATTSHEHEKTGAETRYIKKPSSAPIQHSSSILVKKGMTVKMRTPAGTLPTGQRLVVLNHAVVVSDVAEDGYIQVVYKGVSHYPPMRIALDQLVKIMPPTK